LRISIPFPSAVRYINPFSRKSFVMPASLTVILNSLSGTEGKDELRQRLADLFATQAVSAQIIVADKGADIVGLARRALVESKGPIVAGGGDGTINSVASVLVDTERPLGVLPVGTLNHFAKDFGLPLNLEDAVQILIDGAPIAVDVGEVNGRIFLNNSSLGLYPIIVHQRERLRERLAYGKWPAFAWAAVSAFRRYPFVEARIAVNGQELVRRSPFIFVGNNEYGIEGFDIGARNRLDAGELWLYAVHDKGRWGLVEFALRALFGRLRERQDFDREVAGQIHIGSRRKWLPVATDGEIQLMQVPLHYRIRPGALRVLAPRQKANASEGR
jgi:diacylglycerol kinase family enzyme